MFKTVFHTLSLFLTFLFVGNGLYSQNYIQEKVKLHIDKELYMAGETLWGKVYLLDAFFEKPSTLSKGVLVEFWDTKGNMVLQKKVFIERGTGEFSQQIPSDLISGFYQIRAYSKWMANGPSEDFATYTFRLFNPKSPIPVSEAAAVSATDKKIIEVYPEGGKLIHGIETRVGVMVKDTWGRPTSSIGRIEQADGTVVAVFESNEQGLAEFSITPNANEKYGLRLIPNGDSSQLLSIPSVSPQGISLRVTKEGDLLRIQSVSHKLVDSSLVLDLSKGGYTVYNAALNAESEDQMTSVPTKDFPAGKYLIQIKNGNNALMAWRYVWIGEPQKLTLKLSLSKTSLNTREKIRVDLLTLDESGNPTSANLALSVGHQLQERENAVYKNYEDLDLLVHKAPPVKQEKDSFIYPEIYGHTISGRVTNLSDNLDSAARIIFTLPGKTPYMRTVKTNKRGKFNIALEKIYGVREMGLLAVGLEGTVLDIELDPVFYGTTPYPSTQKLRFSESELDYLQELYIQNQLLFAYQDTFPTFVENRTASIKPFYGYPDKEYILDEYTRFDTEETFNEIVYSISLRKKKGNFSFRAYNEIGSYLMKPPPLVLFDGVPLTDANQLIKINSKLIERIQVVSSIYYQDNFPLHGIISVTSFKGDAAVLAMPPKYIQKPYTFLDPGRNFVKVVHEGGERKRIPDQRNLILWAPNIQTDASGKAFVEFYTSDITGPFTLKASALSSAGLWANEQTNFEVVGGIKR